MLVPPQSELFSFKSVWALGLVPLQGAAAKCCCQWYVRCGAGLPVPRQGGSCQSAVCALELLAGAAAGCGCRVRVQGTTVEPIFISECGVHYDA